MGAACNMLLSFCLTRYPLLAQIICFGLTARYTSVLQCLAMKPTFLQLLSSTVGPQLPSVLCRNKWGCHGPGSGMPNTEVGDGGISWPWLTHGIESLEMTPRALSLTSLQFSGSFFLCKISYKWKLKAKFHLKCLLTNLLLLLGLALYYGTAIRLVVFSTLARISECLFLLLFP